MYGTCKLLIKGRRSEVLAICHKSKYLIINGKYKRKNNSKWTSHSKMLNRLLDFETLYYRVEQC